LKEALHGKVSGEVIRKIFSPTLKQRWFSHLISVVTPLKALQMDWRSSIVIPEEFIPQDTGFERTNKEINFLGFSVGKYLVLY
jgi:hypothetical protein